MTRSSLRVPSIKVDSLAALLVTSLPLVYFNAALRGAIVLASEDGILFNVPMRVTAANIVRAGSLPLWNPYIFSGMPLHAAAQGGILFPLNWFFLFCDNVLATNLMTLTTYMLAALGAYLYARRSGASIAGAISTSVIWQWSGFLIGQYSHINIVQTASLLPWLLWAIDGFGKNGERRYGVVVAAIVMLQAFAGHQQTFFYSLLLATAYALVMWRLQRPERSFYLWSLLRLAAGALLAAVQILPTYELMRNSMRSSASFDFFTSFSLPPKFLFTFFAPFLYGGGDGRLFRVSYFGPPFYGEFIGYVSVAGLMLVAIAVVLTRQDARTKFWLAVALVAYVLAFGRYWPFKSYGVVYFIPVLNLFRVPARHLMEVDLALAVLAGRGLTAFARVDHLQRRTRIAIGAGIPVIVVTFLIVTLGRPASFQLASKVPVTILRAPELFLPIVFAAVSAWCLWRYAQTKTSGRLFLMLLVMAIDLAVWGQTTGWRVSSPLPGAAYWHEPPPLTVVRNAAAQDNSLYRILTAPHPFDPAKEVVRLTTSGQIDSGLWLQPDLYMMWGAENAAGFDGFGVARYSRLAGDMGIWGELNDPDSSLRGAGREVDLINVRYLLAMSRPPEAASSANDSSTPAETVASPRTNVESQVSSFAADHSSSDDLKLGSIGKSSSLLFEIPEVQADRIMLTTSLTWSTELSDGLPVAQLILHTSDGRKVEFNIRVGEHTSEWAYDRRDIRRQIKHRRAAIASSFKVRDAQGSFQGHKYLSEYKLPERLAITGGEIRMLQAESAPDLILTVHGVLTGDGAATFPLRREWFLKRVSALNASLDPFDRWVHVGEAEQVKIWENRRALPRAWLATDVRVLSDEDTLRTIRTGKLPDGDNWEPRNTALLQSPIDFNSRVFEDPSANVAVTHKSANRMEIRTTASFAGILVVSENSFPGWYAYVDGKRANILRVNYNQRGLLLNQGEHVVQFVYFPWSVMFGVIVTTLTLLGLVLWCWRPSFLKRVVIRADQRTNLSVP